VTSTAGEELAPGTDSANPPDATREPLPRANAGAVTPDPDQRAPGSDDDDR